MVFAESIGVAEINKQAEAEEKAKTEAEAEKQARILSLYKGILLSTNGQLSEDACLVLATKYCYLEFAE